MGRKGPATTSATGKWENSDELRVLSLEFNSRFAIRNSKLSFGFTLVEVLVAFTIFAVGLSLIATSFSRHISALRILQDSVTAYERAERKLIKELLTRQENISFPSEEFSDGFTASIDEKVAAFEPESLKDLPLKQLAVDVSWDFRGKNHSKRVTAGFIPPEQPAK